MTQEHDLQSVEKPPYHGEAWFVELRDCLTDREARLGVPDYPPPWWERTKIAGQDVWTDVRVLPEPVPVLNPVLTAAVNVSGLSTDEAQAVYYVTKYNVFSAKGGRGGPEGLKLREIAACLDWERRYGPAYPYGPRDWSEWLAADRKAHAVQKILARAYVKLDRAVRPVFPPRREEAPRRVRQQRPDIFILLFEEIEEMFYAVRRSGKRRDRRALEEAIRRLAR